MFLAPVSGCAACHGTETFTGPAARNNGLDATLTDGGAGAVNNNPALLGKFKVPSLKNIALTAPYMHDGRFQTIEQVIEHYNAGLKDNPSLDPPLRNQDGSVKRLNLSEAQKVALKAFLLTLTDSEMVSDEKFGNPFK